MRRVPVALIVVLLLAVRSHAQVVEFLDESFAYDEAQPAAGVWLGNITRAEGAVSVGQLVIERDDDADHNWKVELTASQLAALHSTQDEVAIDERTVAFTHHLPGGKNLLFSGTVSDDGQRLTGHVRESDPDGETATFEFARTPRPSDLPQSSAYTGNMQTGAIALEMTFVLAQTPGGHWVGHLDVPLQELREFPLINVREEGGEIVADLPVPGGATLRAKIDEDRNTLSGTFHQSGMTFPINFEKDANYAYRELPRPQHPLPPYPYETREVEAATTEGFSLAGTLTIPNPDEFGSRPFPTAVLISGSGQQDRDETLVGHKPFLVIADYLTRHGIAVMRYDDRGVGGSQVEDLDLVLNATTRDNAADAIAVINAIKDLDVVDGSRIGLIGHSEGGMIAPMVAHQTGDIAFMVLLAGPGVCGDELLALQQQLIWKAMGIDEEAMETMAEGFQSVLTKLREGAPDDELRDAVKEVSRQALESLGTEGGEAADAQIELGIQQLTSPWMRFFLSYDPAPALAAATCPVLALNGTKDLQVWHEQNLDAIIHIMDESGGDLTAKRYEGLNHLFQPAKTGSPAEYAAIETTIDEQVLRDIADWITLKTGG